MLCYQRETISLQHLSASTKFGLVVDPVWPNTLTTPIGTGGEQGDPVGHLASCAYLILKTKDLYNKKVTIGDPHGYGDTYLSRAKKYLAEADYSMSHHILESELDLSNDNRMYFAKEDPYMGGQLCDAHRILGDNPTLLDKYKGIMVASLDWFFNGGGSKTKKDSKENEAIDWSYVVGESTAEDSNHGALDVAGFARAYISGDYGITADRMKTFANTFVDVMTLGEKKYAGRVDGTSRTGHATPTTYVRSGYLFLAEFRSDAYESMVSADLTQGGTTQSADTFSRFLWVKN
jgi:hypothetical protein